MTAPPPSLRVAVLGLGFMGSTHLKALAGVAGARIAAVCSGDPRKLEGDLTHVRGNTGGPGGTLDLSSAAKYRDIEALLADPSIDAVDLCLPTDLHAPVALQALRAGKHVLVEKPIALSSRDAAEMAGTAEHHGRVLMAAHVLRFWPEYLALRDAVQTRPHGPLLSAEFRRRCAAPAWGGWLQDPKRSGGAILDLLIHDVDMCLHLLGMPQTVSATGFTGANGLDWIDATLEWSGGERAIISGGWQHPGEFPFTMEFTATFESATLDYSSASRPLTVYPRAEPARTPALPSADAYREELQYFTRCCISGTAPELCPPRESAAAVRLTERILESRRLKGEMIECTK